MTTLVDFRRCPDVSSLRASLREVAAPVGPLKRLDILTSVHEGRQQAICFLRMETAEQEQALMKSLGVGRFGGEIVFVVDLEARPSDEDNGPSSQWTEYGAM